MHVLGNKSDIGEHDKRQFTLPVLLCDTDERKKKDFSALPWREMGGALESVV